MTVAIPYMKWGYHKVHKTILHNLCRRLYRDADRDIGKSIMVAGTARSGTTWLANIIDSQVQSRIMFEPFHSANVEQFRNFHYFHYMRPTEENEDLLSFCRTIFSGDIKHPWIDKNIQRIFPRYRIIKEIRANLFLKWIHNLFPQMPMLVIIRHPCAVVLSRMQLGWATDTDIGSLMSQKELIDDFLFDKIDLIGRANTVEEKHAIIWCISNLVPLRQFDSGSLTLFFYEKLCSQPEVEIPRIFKTINHDFNNSVFEYADQPSTTAGTNSAVVSGDNKVTRWKKELSSNQISKILSVVDEFKLDYIYGERCTPLVS